MVSSSDLKYKLMRRDFQPITFLDCSRTYFMYFYMKYHSFYMYVYVYMYICMCMYMYMYMYVCVCVCVYMGYT